MGVVVKQSIQSIIITLFGVALGLAINLLSMHYFPKVEFGFYQNLAKIATLVSYIGLFGFNYALVIKGQQYIHPHPKRGAFLSITAIIPIVTSLLAIIGYFVFKQQFIQFYEGENSEMMERYFSLFPIFTIFVSMSIWLEGFHQSINKNTVQSFAREVLARVFNISLIFAYGLGWIDFDIFITAFAFTYLLPAIYMYWKAKSSDTLYFEGNNGQFSRQEIKSLLTFSGYQTFVVLALLLIQQIDIILLGGLDANGFQSIAVYSIAAFAINAIRNPLRAVSNASLPTITRLFNEQSWVELDEKYKKVAASMFLGAMALGLLMVCNLSAILSILNMLAPGYDAVIVLIPILLLGCVLELSTGISMELISISKYFRFNLLATVLMLIIIIGLNYYLIDQYGIYGAAWATTIGVILYGMLKAWFVWVKFKIQPYNIATVKIIILTLATYGILYIIPHFEHPFVDIIVRSMIIGFLLLIGTYLLKITEETTQVINKFLIKLRILK